MGEVDYIIAPERASLKVLYALMPCLPNMTRRPAQKITGTKENTRTIMVLNRAMIENRLPSLTANASCRKLKIVGARYNPMITTSRVPMVWVTMPWIEPASPRVYLYRFAALMPRKPVTERMGRIDSTSVDMPLYCCSTG